MAEDDGEGFDTAEIKEGIELQRIKLRASVLNGTLEIDSDPGRGTTLDIIVPLQAEAVS